MFKKISALLLLGTLSVLSAESQEVQCLNSESKLAARSNRKCKSFCCLSVSGNANIGGTLTVGGNVVNNLFAEQTYANFYNTAANIALAVGDSIPFPTAGVVSGTGIASNVGGTVFTLSAIGTYEVTWQASLNGGVAGPFSFALFLNNAQVTGTVVGQNDPDDSIQIVGNTLIKTITANSTLDIRLTGANGVTINPSASNAASNATITIKRLS